MNKYSQSLDLQTPKGVFQFTLDFDLARTWISQATLASA